MKVAVNADLLTLITLLQRRLLPISPLTTRKAKWDELATLSVSNKSTNAVSYEWDFGNGDKSTEANPKYNYKIHGNYTVTLKATDQKGKASTSTKQITVLCIFGGGPHDQ